MIGKSRMKKVCDIQVIYYYLDYSKSDFIAHLLTISINS